MLKIAKFLYAQSGEVPNFVSFHKEYVVEDYPYGRYQTKATYKVETKGRQQRVTRITIDPKTHRVNAPKATTYASAAIIGVAQDGKTYPIIGNPGHISIMKGDMQYSQAAVFTKDPAYEKLAKELGFKKNTVEIKHVENGVVISGIPEEGITIKTLLIDAGFKDKLNQIEKVDRKDKITHLTYTVIFKDKKTPNFTIDVYSI